jgi:hypothetical protein
MNAVIPTFRKWRQENQQFKASLSYIASSKPGYMILCLEKKKKPKYPESVCKSLVQVKIVFAKRVTC